MDTGLKFNSARRKSGTTVEPLVNSIRSNRYQERVKAREKLRQLDIIDVAKSPQSVMSHGLLTMDSGNAVDILTQQGMQPN